MPGQSDPQIDKTQTDWNEFVKKRSDGHWHRCPAELPKPSSLDHLRAGDKVSVIEKGAQGAGMAAISTAKVVTDFSSQGVIAVTTDAGKTYRFNRDGSIVGYLCAQVIVPPAGS